MKNLYPYLSGLLGEQARRVLDVRMDETHAHFAGEGVGGGDSGKPALDHTGQFVGTATAATVEAHSAAKAEKVKAEAAHKIARAAHVASKTANGPHHPKTEALKAKAEVTQKAYADASAKEISLSKKVDYEKEKSIDRAVAKDKEQHSSRKASTFAGEKQKSLGSHLTISGVKKPIR